MIAVDLFLETERKKLMDSCENDEGEFFNFCLHKKPILNFIFIKSRLCYFYFFT